MSQTVVLGMSRAQQQQQQPRMESNNTVRALTCLLRCTRGGSDSPPASERHRHRRGPRPGCVRHERPVRRLAVWDKSQAAGEARRALYTAVGRAKAERF